MKKLFLVGLLILVLGLFLVPPALAAEGAPPIGVCPRGFQPEHLHGEHMHDHDHHIGLAVDLNDNRMICVKRLDNGLHVHVDDVIPVR